MWGDWAMTAAENVADAVDRGYPRETSFAHNEEGNEGKNTKHNRADR